MSEDAGSTPTEPADGSESTPEPTVATTGGNMNDELKTKLGELSLSGEQINKLETEGVTNPDDMALLSAENVQSITGCGLVTAKKVAAAFAPAPTNTTVDQSILPVVPDDFNFTEQLKIGGIAKIGTTEVVSAVRAAIANKAHMFDLPAKIVAGMEKFAMSQDEPVSAEYYKLQKLVTQRNYGEVLSALDITGNFMSESKKNTTLSRLDEMLWPALYGYYGQLNSWVDTWNKTAGNSMQILAMLAMSSAGRNNAMPPMAMPETTTLRDAAEGVINQINKVFAGFGIPVARALAWDAMRIKEVLDEPTLPAALGVATKEMMLKSLGVDVGPDYPRMEANVARFTLSIMDVPKVSAGPEEYNYFAAMLQLGGHIPWDLLMSDSRYRPSARNGATEDEPEMAGSFRGSSGRR